ncbi:adenylate/guanylate cyclase domain-containing protein [Lutimaribacter marinistellae]|uniref:Adenylate/guanylate cyclase domain-containing protein n=1 Tax=Lutimaribacter marinistellae TaxID=1820329 RepID=A0ABV7TLL9_9RHOB
MERRIAAVLAADMVGYSRLIERDEVGTLKRQKRHLQELIEPTISAKNGRIVKLTGDGLIAEFSSVVEAVQCAVSVQAEMAVREEDIPDDEKIRYRVAVHLGDVVFDDGDVYGDGVNVAARLEGLAEPGGVVVSGTAYDVLKANVDVAYKSLGEKQLKNIAAPVRVYQVVDGVPIAPVPRGPNRPRWIAAVVVTIAIIAGFLWWQQRRGIDPINPEELAFALPRKPSLAVMAFENLSGDSSTAYIGDGLAEAVITGLAQNPKLFVISRNSSFSYKGTPTKIQTIAEELGVRYVLEGSFQTDDEQLLVTARLIDALKGVHLWAETFKRDLSTEGLLKVYDEIVDQIAVELSVEMIAGDQARLVFVDAGDLETYNLFGQMIAEYQSGTPESIERAINLANRAIERNPKASLPYAILAWASFFRISAGLTDDPEKDFANARKNAEAANSLSPETGVGHPVLAHLDLLERNYPSALEHADHILIKSPHDGTSTALAGWVYSASGNPERGLELLMQAIRAEPFYPDFFAVYLGQTYLMLERWQEARDVFLALYGKSPNYGYSMSLAIAFVQLGAVEDARLQVQKELKSNPSRITIQTFLAWFGYVNDPSYLEMSVSSLQLADVPEK